MTQLQNGDVLYTSSSKTTKFATPGSSTNHFYAFTDGSRYHFKLGNANGNTPASGGGNLDPGEVDSVTVCSVASTPTPTRTRTRTRTKSTSSSGSSCISNGLGHDKFSASAACTAANFPTTYYLDGSFAAGTRAYTNSSCTFNSPTGFYSNGLVAFEKTTTGGSFTNGSLCGFGFPSDRRLKMNIQLIGVSLSGIKIYTFEYKDKAKYGEGVYQGVMSDEIPQEAVIKTESGYDRVDYTKLDVEFKRIK